MNEKIAVIDIGSNSVRLMLVADGKVLYKTLDTTRLGEGIATSPSLKSEAIERSALAVANFYERAKAEGASTVCAFATAAVRSADNGDVFVRRVKELCPLDVDVISGEEEAEIGILGALGEKDGGIVDAGGASTEIIVKKGGAVLYEKSVNIGVVRLKDMCGRDISKLYQSAKKAVLEYGIVPNGVPMYAIGGTATTLAALSLGLKTYDPERVTGTKISVEEMRALADRLTNMSVTEIAALPCMPQKRADVIGGGAVLLSVLMDKLSIPALIVSDRDNLEGYALKHKWMV
jgi:exopolyphosphatase/guanosine-5'-triphosphate,3'-diphosphate pyrophosphatase